MRTIPPAAALCRAGKECFRLSGTPPFPHFRGWMESKWRGLQRLCACMKRATQPLQYHEQLAYRTSNRCQQAQLSYVPNSFLTDGTIAVLYSRGWTSRSTKREMEISQKKVRILRRLGGGLARVTHGDYISSHVKLIYPPVPPSAV